MTSFDILIVGGGHAGAQAAIALRQGGCEESIAIVGDEPHPPYERPPLSKEYLSGEKSFDRILLRQPSFWTERNVVLLTERRVVRIDPAARTVTTTAGETIGYRTLVWAAGGTPRRLSCVGADLIGVHTMRNRADADRMMAELPTVRRVAVIGGGYIGLEAAAVLRKAGKEVVLLEALDRVLARVAGEPLSRFFEAEHRAQGVDIRLGSTVDRLEGADGRVTGVRLADGELIEAAMVVVGIGIVPEVAPLAEAGAAIGNGVIVDDACRTSLPDVFAIGDCAAHPNPFADGALIRLESVQNANDQAGVVAKQILGEHARYDAVPWFWSNQYDLKLQTVGLASGHDQALVRGNPATRKFSVVYLRENRVVALDCVNMVRDYVQGRRLVVERLRVSSNSLADDAVALKDMQGRALSGEMHGSLGADG